MQRDADDGVVWVDCQIEAAWEAEGGSRFGLDEAVFEDVGFGGVGVVDSGEPCDDTGYEYHCDEDHANQNGVHHNASIVTEPCYVANNLQHRRIEAVSSYHFRVSGTPKGVIARQYFGGFGGRMSSRGGWHKI
jgi:hypothetical protein